MFFIKKGKKSIEKKTSRLKIVQICTRVKNTAGFFIRVQTNGYSTSNKRKSADISLRKMQI